jgi:hypothetical protein
VRWERLWRGKWARLARRCSWRVAAKRARFVWPREEGGGSRGCDGDRARARGAQPDAHLHSCGRLRGLQGFKSGS